MVIDSVDVDHFLMTLDHAELRGDHEDFDSFTYISRTGSKDLDTYANDDTQLDTLDSIAFAPKTTIQDHAHQYVEYLGYHPVNIVRKTLRTPASWRKRYCSFQCNDM